MSARKNHWRRVGGLRWRFEFKAADCWIGVFWSDRNWRYSITREVWICLLPTLPIHLRWRISEWTDNPALEADLYA